MKRSKFSEEQIAFALRQAESGTPVADISRQLGDVLPLEKKYVHLRVSELRRELRILGNYPARFLFVGTPSSCNCGNAGDPVKSCSCSPLQVQRYHARISGPLLDRVDIHLHVPPVAYDDLAARTPVETSAQIRRRVEAARDRQLVRFRSVPGVFANAHMGPRELARYVELDAATESVLKGAIVKLGLSARAYHRVLKLARTLADLEAAEHVGAGHVAEAIQYRVLDRGGNQAAPSPV